LFRAQPEGSAPQLDKASDDAEDETGYVQPAGMQPFFQQRAYKPARKGRAWQHHRQIAVSCQRDHCTVFFLRVLVRLRFQVVSQRRLLLLWLGDSADSLYTILV